MKKIQLLLLLSLLAFSVCKFDKNSPIYQKLEESLEVLEKNMTEFKGIPIDQTVLSIIGKGFKHFSRGANAYKLRGIKEESLNNAIKQIAEMIKLPEDKIPVIISACLEQIETCDYEDIVMFSIIYKAKGTKNAYFSSFMVQQREKNGKTVYDFVIGTVKAEFDLAPDYYILEEKKNKLSLFFKRSYWKISIVPKFMTEYQAKQIMQFFRFSVIRAMAAIVGVIDLKNKN